MGLLSKLFGTGEKPDFSALLANGAKVIDVRTPGEFNSGALKTAINIPLDRIEQQLDKIKGFNQTVIVVCKSGGRASMAKSILSKAGIACHNAGAWQNLK